MITNPVSAPASPVQASGNSTTGRNGIDALANEQTFLKLFVAQLQNQNPLQPQDGLQFVSQLAQFSGVEQSLQIRQDLDSILKIVQNKAAAPSPVPQQP